MRLCSGQNDAVLEWLSKRVDFTLSPLTKLIWCVSDLDGTLLGAMGFGGRMGRTWGSISIAITEPHATPSLVRAGACFLFGTMQARAGYVTITSKRHNWIDSLERIIGFEEVDRVENGAGPREDRPVGSERGRVPECLGGLQQIRSHVVSPRHLRARRIPTLRPGVSLAWWWV